MVIIIIILSGVSAAQNLTFPLSRLCHECHARSLFPPLWAWLTRPLPPRRPGAAVGGTRERVSEQE